ncbi:MAG: site-2 protease family protein [Oscillospiraceae bacterium]|nr:site-2 protease family protein [Oscillospiraceae bacterium]
MILIYILLVILLFGALVAIHESGHFFTAKLSGVKVNEFAIGMGPAIFKKQYGETLYAIRLLPFGGFCAMEGEDAKSDDPRAFGNISVFKRIIIVLAGSLTNLVAGFLVLAVVFAPVREWYTPIVENAPVPVEATENVLRSEDVIRSVDGYKVYLYNDIFFGLDRGGEDQKYDIEVSRNGKKILLENVVLISGGENTDSANQITFKIQKSSFLNKTAFVFKNGANLVRLVIVGLWDLLRGAVSTEGMAGPVGIGKIMVDTAKVSMSSLWYLLAFISINLGVMNLLPFPALDGGRFVFLLIELIFGKTVPKKYEGYIHLAGLAILMLFMVFITFNDISGLIFK